MKLSSNLSIRERIIIGFALSIFLIGLPLVLDINTIIFLYKTSNENYAYYKVRTNLMEVNNLSKILLIDAKKLSEAKTKTEILNYSEAFHKNYMNAINYLHRINQLDYQSEKLLNIKNSIKSISDKLEDIKLYFGVIKTNKLALLKELSISKFVSQNLIDKQIKTVLDNYNAIEKHVITIGSTINKISHDINKILHDNELSIKNHLESAKNISLLLLTFLIIIALVIILYLSSRIDNQLTSLSNIIRKISWGSLPDFKGYSGSNELGFMSESIKNLISSLKETTEFTAQLAQGNFDVEITPLSDHDELRNLLLDLRDSLKHAKLEQEKREKEDAQRRRVSEGLAKFADLLRGHQKNLKELAEEIIIELVRYLDAVQGTFFILNDNDPQNPYLELLSAYAWNRKKYIEKRINMGEGLIGAVALEKFTIHITDVPEDYIEIKSGIGEADPKAILIVPLTTEDNVLGVLEIAALKVFKDYEIELVEKIGESIAATLQNIKINEKTEELLKTTRKQTEEMKRQEDLMKKNIEDLKKMIKDKTIRMQEIQHRIKETEKNLMAEKVKSQKISEQLKKLKEELKQATIEIEFYKKLINIYEKPILITDNEGSIVFTNDSFSNEFGNIKGEGKIKSILETLFGKIEFSGDISELNDKKLKSTTSQKVYLLKHINISTLTEQELNAIVIEPIETKEKEILPKELQEKVLSYQIALLKLQKLLKTNNIEVDLKNTDLKIEWVKEFETGIKSIDEQHKKWIDIINKLTYAIEHNEEESELGKIFNELIEFTRYHFAYEEKYMDQFGFELKEEHKVVHNEFISRLLSVFNKYIKGDITAAIELMDLLINWVIKHVTKTDRTYIELFKSKGLE